MLKHVELEIGKTYFHTSGLKTFKVIIEYGNCYVLLPTLIETGAEMAPIVVGDNDLPFFKNLSGTGSEEELKKKLNEMTLASFKDQLQAVKENRDTLFNLQLHAAKTIEELNTKIQDLKMIMFKE
jgi:hypothetical protein